MDPLKSTTIMIFSLTNTTLIGETINLIWRNSSQHTHIPYQSHLARTNIPHQPPHAKQLQQ